MSPRVRVREKSPENEDHRFILSVDENRRRENAQESDAITSPELHGVFLEVEWDVDQHGNITQSVPGSGGIMILNTANIRTIRILEGGQE